MHSFLLPFCQILFSFFLPLFSFFFLPSLLPHPCTFLYLLYSSTANQRMMEVSLSSSLPMPSSDMAAAPVAASAASATQQYSAETEPMSHASSSSFCHQFSSSESRPSSMHGPMVTGKEAAARPELPPIVDMPMRGNNIRGEG